MQNLILTINIIIPTFLMIALGYLLKQIKMFDDHTLKIMNNVTFKIFLPASLFYNVYSTDLNQSFNPKLMIYAGSSIIISFFIAWLIVPRLESDNNKKGVIIQGVFRSNFVLFGMPISIAIFGTQFAGTPSMLISVIVPIFNFLAVIILEVYRGNKINYGKIIKGIVTNPLILASILGLIFAAMKIKLPTSLDTGVQDLAKIAMSLALIILGGSFHFNSIKKSKRQLIWTVIGRLIIVPGVFVPLAVFLGFRNIELGTLIVMFAAPTAISSFTMAEQIKADSELAGNIVVFTSTCAIVTMFVWIYITKQLGLM